MGVELGGRDEHQFSLMDLINLFAIAVILCMGLLVMAHIDHHNRVIEKQEAEKVEIERGKAEAEVKQGWEIVGRCGE